LIDTRKSLSSIGVPSAPMSGSVAPLGNRVQHLRPGTKRGGGRAGGRRSAVDSGPQLGRMTAGHANRRTGRGRSRKGAHQPGLHEAALNLERQA
jgi:hypothetical protein